MADVFDKTKRSKVMSAVRSNNNKSTELRLISYFNEYGIKGWRRNYKVKGHPDFVFLDKRVAVFVDGCFWHGAKNNRTGVKPYIKVGYHEGLVDSATWLAVQDKKSHNKKFSLNTNTINSWLAGLVKCEYCGYSLHIVYSWNKKRTKQWRYYHDAGYHHANGCLKKTLQTRPDDVEAEVFKAMKERIKTLEIAKKRKAKPDKEVEKISAEIARCDDEIRKLMDKLADADAVVFDYIQSRIKEFHGKKTELEMKLQKQQRKHKEIDTKPLTEPLKNWDNLSVQEKHEIALTMIEVVTVSDENGIDIKFSI